ncbi:MAG: hypothetical protein EAY66_00905 [Sphingobacteriales bacterium]|nr:MAG: hypothetical protein EAY66_00905 [Sphingobacteriales bacterium]
MTLKQIATINTKHPDLMPNCPNCYLPFKCRVKRNPLLKFIFRNHNFKKYWCEKCNSTFAFIEKKG